MMVYGAPVARYVAQKVGQEFVPPFTAIGVEENGEVVAGGVFNHWTGCDVHLSIASEPGKITRLFLKTMGEYVRDKLCCERVTFVTESPLVVSMALRLGAEHEGRMRNHFGPGRDGLVLGILKQDWKF
jgi:hypothetical protein